MVKYKDSRVLITESEVSLKGVVAPFISDIHIEARDIEDVKCVELSNLEKVNFLGTQNLTTWWCFDLMKPMRSKGIILVLKEAIGPFTEVGFTPDDSEKAWHAIKEIMASQN